MSGEILTSVVAVTGFALGLKVARVFYSAQNVLSAVNQGIASMFDQSLPDDEKEKLVRQAGLALVTKTLGLSSRLAAAFALAALPIMIADLAGLVPAQATSKLILSGNSSSECRFLRF